MQKIIKLSLSLSIFWIGTTLAQAQNRADDIIRKAQTAFVADGGVRANFVMEAKDQKGRTQRASGTVAFEGSSFYVETGQFQTWFDGKNQWVRIEGNKEVNLTQPSEKEMELYNPSQIFNLSQKGYQLAYKGEIKNKKRVVGDEVDFKTQTAKNNIETLTVAISRSNNQITRIVMANGKEQSTIRLSNYKTKQTFPEGFFRYPTNKYPNNKIIDLR